MDKEYKKEIDWEVVDRLLEAGCTQIRIAGAVGVDRDTLRDRIEEKYKMSYSAYSAMMHSKGEALIEAAQMKSALKGSTQMQIWLGKVRLGQRDSSSNENLPMNDKQIGILNENIHLRVENRELKNAIESKTGNQLHAGDSAV